jgi:hypothetical protein
MDPALKKRYELFHSLPSRIDKKYSNTLTPLGKEKSATSGGIALHIPAVVILFQKNLIDVFFRSERSASREVFSLSNGLLTGEEGVRWQRRVTS